MAGFLVYLDTHGVPIKLLIFDTFADAAKAADPNKSHELISCGNINSLITKRPQYIPLLPKEPEPVEVPTPEPEINPNLRRAATVACGKPKKPIKPKK
jgi:hypothetical protein